VKVAVFLQVTVTAVFEVDVMGSLVVAVNWFAVDRLASFQKSSGSVSWSGAAGTLGNVTSSAVKGGMLGEHSR